MYTSGMFGENSGDEKVEIEKRREYVGLELKPGMLVQGTTFMPHMRPCQQGAGHQGQGHPQNGGSRHSRGKGFQST